MVVVSGGLVSARQRNYKRKKEEKKRKNEKERIQEKWGHKGRLSQGELNRGRGEGIPMAAKKKEG